MMKRCCTIGFLETFLPNPSLYQLMYVVHTKKPNALSAYKNPNFNFQVETEEARVVGTNEGIYKILL